MISNTDEGVQMAGISGIDWEDAFSNSAYIPDSADYSDKWAQQATLTRDRVQTVLNISYGSHAREAFDLFLPESVPVGLVVFIHGGYWLNFDKFSWSHLATGALDCGWAVAIPGYVLAPEASIPDITRQIGCAVTAAAGRIEGPICLVGHSAGGHLVTRMICADTPLDKDIASRIQRVVSISGVHDLRPLLLHSMNLELGLSTKTAEMESPALLTPATSAEVIAWVGAGERPEFLRQSSLLTETWGLKGAQTRLVVEADRHHFNVIDGLTNADHQLCRTLVGADQSAN